MKGITVLCILGVMLLVLEASDAADSTTAAPEADKEAPTTEAGKKDDAEKADGAPDAESGKGDPSEFIRKLIQSAVSKMTSDVKKRLEVIPFTLLKK